MRDRVDYDERQFAVYAAGRALSESGLRDWMDVYRRYTGTGRSLAVLDLGCGTGRFTAGLADTFNGPVYGVEPARLMLATAIRSAQHPRVTYLCGRAERIPLRSASVDLVHMYLVFHHVRDRQAAAGEIARVLRPGGRLLLRSGFSDRLPDLLWHRYFVRARALEEELFPSLKQVVDTFAAVGMPVVALDRIKSRIAPSLTDYARRLRLRAVSVFEYMTEQEIADGFAALDVDVAREQELQPVEEDRDLLVLAATN